MSSSGDFEILRERLLVRYSVDPTTDCWIYTGAINMYGYGHISLKRKTYLAHRVSYSLFAGPIPQGMCVCHKCDRPACINPIHLWLGTNADNVRDRNLKGRNRCAVGEKQWASKLTDIKVKAIRILYANGISVEDLASMFEISRSRAHTVARGACWKHVE
jgi:hypothetical protein